MKNKIKKLLYYLSWTIGLMAVGALVYGIVRTLIGG